MVFVFQLIIFLKSQNIIKIQTKLFNITHKLYLINKIMGCPHEGEERMLKCNNIRVFEFEHDLELPILEFLILNDSLNSYVFFRFSKWYLNMT